MTWSRLSSSLKRLIQTEMQQGRLDHMIFCFTEGKGEKETLSKGSGAIKDTKEQETIQGNGKCTDEWFDKNRAI